MSQLIDKLNRVARTAPAPPMGFRMARAAQAKPQMLLVASLARPESMTGLGVYIAGADAVLLEAGQTAPEAKAIQKITKSLDIPWGGWRRDIDEKGTAAMIDAGADFIAFPSGSLVSGPQGDKAGKVLQVAPSLNGDLLRAVNDLPVDAVLIADEAGAAGSLTWDDLLHFQRAANLLSKPLLVSVPPTASVGDLQLLWDIGVDGVVIAVSAELPADRFKELRRAAGELASSPLRKRRKTGALMPSLRVETPTEREAEEEAETEDE